MFYSDNPVLDYERYSAEREAELEKLPRCSECDEPIQEEHCYEVNGELICETCMQDNHRKFTEDFL